MQRNITECNDVNKMEQNGTKINEIERKINEQLATHRAQSNQRKSHSLLAHLLGSIQLPQALSKQR